MDKGIKIGDLVRLKDDDGMDVGVGLVLAEKESTGFTEVVSMYHACEDPKFIDDIEEFLLFKPIYLVLWQGESISPTDSPVWMFSTELAIVENLEEE